MYLLAHRFIIYYYHLFYKELESEVHVMQTDEHRVGAKYFTGSLRILDLSYCTEQDKQSTTSIVRAVLAPFYRL